MLSQATMGIIIMCCASLFFSIMGACVKFLDHLSPMEIIFFRHVYVVLFVLIWWVYLAYKGEAKHILPYKKGGFQKLLIHSLAGGLAMVALFYNIATISLGTASAFGQTMPIYMVLFSILFMRQRVGLPLILATIVGFIGVVLICDPHADSLHISNIIAGVSGGMMMVIACRIIRELNSYFSESFIVMAFALVMLIMSGVVMFLEIPNLSGFRMPNATEWVVLVAVGIFGTLGQIAFTRAFLLAPAGLIAPIDYMRILWGVFFGILLGDSLPSMVTLAGIALIILSGMCIAMPAFLEDYKKFKKT